MRRLDISQEAMTFHGATAPMHGALNKTLDACVTTEDPKAVLHRHLVPPNRLRVAGDAQSSATL